MDWIPPEFAGQTSALPQMQPNVWRSNPNQGMTHTPGPTPVDAITPVEGYAHGVTSGTFDYLPASIATVLDKLGRGNNLGWQEDFRQMLKYTRKRNEEVKASNPAGYALGDIAGSIHLNTMLRGSGLPLEILKQGTQAGVRNYAANEETGLRSAGEAALAAGTLTAGLGGIGKAVNYGINSNALKFLQNIPGTTKEEAKDMLAAFKNPIIGKEAQSMATGMATIASTPTKSDLWNVIKDWGVPTTVSGGLTAYDALTGQPIDYGKNLAYGLGVKLGQEAIAPMAGRAALGLANNPQVIQNTTNLAGRVMNPVINEVFNKKEKAVTDKSGWKPPEFD